MRFRRITKGAFSFVMSLCPSARMEKLGSHLTDFQGIWCLGIFRKPVEKTQLSLKYDKNNKYFMWRPVYLLTPLSRVLLEKLTGSAASQEIPHIFGTRRFITVLTSARHMSLNWANSIQSSQLPPTSWRSILILSSHLRLVSPLVSFPQVYHPHNIR